MECFTWRNRALALWNDFQASTWFLLRLNNLNVYFFSFSFFSLFKFFPIKKSQNEKILIKTRVYNKNCNLNVFFPVVEGFLCPHVKTEEFYFHWNTPLCMSNFNSFLSRNHFKTLHSLKTMDATPNFSLILFFHSASTSQKYVDQDSWKCSRIRDNWSITSNPGITSRQDFKTSTSIRSLPHCQYLRWQSHQSLMRKPSVTF